MNCPIQDNTASLNNMVPPWISVIVSSGPDLGP
jgi:hypothetical protein